MDQFDVLEFSNLSDTKKDSIRTVLKQFEIADNKQVERTLISTIFEMMAPGSSGKLLTQIKDFNQLGLTEKDADHGIHVMRSYLAHRYDEKRARRFKLRDQMASSSAYDSTGVAVLCDFIPEERRLRIIEEMKSFPLATSKNENNLVARQFRTAMYEVLFPPSPENSMYNIAYSCLGYSNAEIASLYQNNTFVQKLHNVKGDGDVQKVFHQDTFFPCLKFWYFPEEVTLESGPFEYAFGSHRFTYARAKYTYEESIRIASGQAKEYTKDHKEGSLRITPEKLKQSFGLIPTPVPVPANTLVIANVFGFHRRSEVVQEGFRNSIHGSIRTTKPFEE